MTAMGCREFRDKLEQRILRDLAETPVQAQLSIEPTPAHLTDQGQINPVRWHPDPAWGPAADADHIGLSVTKIITTGIKHQGLIAQRIDGQMLMATVGEDRTSRADKILDWDVYAGSSVACFTGKGQLLWRQNFRGETCRESVGPWPAFIDTTGHGDWGVSIFVIHDGGEGKRRGCLYFYEARAGKLVWQRAIPPAKYPGGNGACVTGDLDGDGRIEIVYGLCNCVMCVDARTGRIKWVYDDRIKICHGRLALCDVNDDGRPEIVVATEYADRLDDPTNDRSSILALDGHGHLLRRMCNIQGDLGSTAIVVADVDGDGRPEIIHGSENLCYHEPRHMAELMVRERWLTSKLDYIALGGVRFAVGDMDADGYPEAIGVTGYRDGGPYVKPEIYSVRLCDGRVNWRRPVARVWFDGDAVMADLDGDGRLEAVVTASYSSGYMQAAGTDPWCDLYIVKGDGRIVYKQSFTDAAISPIAVDADGDGRAEIVVPCYDGTVYAIRTPGPAADADWPLVCQNAERTGVYPNHKLRGTT